MLKQALPAEALCKGKTICTRPAHARHRYITKTLMVMKLTILLLTTALVQLHATGLSQEVTYEGKSVNLETVFKEVEKQTGFTFFYYEDVLKDAKPVSIAANNLSLPGFLDELFKIQFLSYSIKGKNVIVSKKTMSSTSADLKSPTLFFIPPLTGIIRDSEGNPVPGVNIVVKGTKRGVTTDVNGKFSIEVGINETLVLSSVGYNEKELKINNINAPLIIALEKSISQLDEVQYIAYGTTTNRLSTGNIATVTAKDIAKQPVSNPLLALQGRVPGMVIQQATGNPGSGISVLIQGKNTISAGTDPFYVIDGVPYSSQLVQDGGIGNILGTSGTGNGSLNGNGNPLSYVNPDDIESITILKDADATSIYGSRAANGAIIITTRKGKPGATRVDINANRGFGKVPRFVEMMNNVQYLSIRREALSNDGLPVGPSDYDLNGSWDTTRNVNWQKELIGGTARYSNMNVSISGGNETTRFLVSSSYNLQGTVQLDPHDEFNDRKASLYFNIDNVSLNKKFKVQLNGSYLIDNNHLPLNDMTRYSTVLAPMYPALYNKDGDLNWGSEANPNYNSDFNPAAEQARFYSNKTYHLNSHLQVGYEILRGLELKTGLGYDNLQSNKFTATPWTSISPLYKSFGFERTASYANSNINLWIVEPGVAYKRIIGKGTFDATIGGTFQQQNNIGNTIYGSGYKSDDQLSNLSNASKLSNLGSVNITTKYMATFGRLGFNWGNKYLINISGRRDGSSRFGSANLFHNYGAIGMAWIFSEEDFMRKWMPFLSFGKLKASYGATGNDQVGDYVFMTLYAVDNIGNPYQGLSRLYPNKMPNPYYGWETTRKSNIGAEMGILENRILLTVNYQVNRTSRLLTDMPIPLFTGFGTIKGNLPAKIQNASFEISLRSSNIKRKNFEWSSSFNLTIARNKLVSFPDLSSSAYSDAYIVGKPTNILRLYPYLGVDESIGLFSFKTVEGNVTTTPSYSADRAILKPIDPRYYGGLENSFNYKGLTFSFLLQFTKKIAPRPFWDQAYMYGKFNRNLPAYVFGNFWQQPGDRKEFPKLTSGYNNFTNWFAAGSSEFNYVDASFIRCTNMSLSWQLPVSWVRKVRIKDFRLYAQGQNLFTITSYEGLDPETASTSSLPILRTITLGLKIGL